MARGRKKKTVNDAESQEAKKVQFTPKYDIDLKPTEKKEVLDTHKVVKSKSGITPKHKPGVSLDDINNDDKAGNRKRVKCLQLHYL